MNELNDVKNSDDLVGNWFSMAFFPLYSTFICTTPDRKFISRGATNFRIFQLENAAFNSTSRTIWQVGCKNLSLFFCINTPERARWRELLERCGLIATMSVSRDKRISLRSWMRLDVNRIRKTSLFNGSLENRRGNVEVPAQEPILDVDW